MSVRAQELPTQPWLASVEEFEWPPTMFLAHDNRMAAKKY